MMKDLWTKFQPFKGTSVSTVVLMVPINWGILFALSFMVAKAARMGWGE